MPAYKIVHVFHAVSALESMRGYSRREDRDASDPEGHNAVWRFSSVAK